MKYAIVDGQRTEASPQVRGKCPGCEKETIARCGRYVRWHWAHAPNTPCGDKWWESETAWHRNWKERFPAEWQEVPVFDEALTDCHIADVKTAAGLVIEFQRSTIRPEEVEARQKFYQRMIWVIDGSRNESDRINFNNMRSGLSDDGLVDFVWYGRSKLFHRWRTTKPVFIDFGDEYGFWRILRFDPISRRGRAGLVNRDGFVTLASSGTTDFDSIGGPAST